MREIILIAHNLRSCHNVGSLLRTAEGLGVRKVILSGYTPCPSYTGDHRLPHEVAKIAKQIHKTALGAEDTVPWEYHADILPVLAKLKKNGYCVAVVEQAKRARQLPGYRSPKKIALLVGREVEGVEPEVLTTCDLVLEIPMLGRKESFNVVQAAAMALYHCRFMFADS
ncbi:MAG TPA: TrmH family RNA methyltransferase [Candidatus Saccharimonadales bacterium]|nr:TrmH family RNA methyltransferase [Candidatus Saccharimonadales bacterium]